MWDARAQDGVSIKKMVEGASNSVSGAVDGVAGAAKGVYEAEIPKEQLFEFGGSILGVILYGLFFFLLIGIAGVIAIAVGKILIFPLRIYSLFILRRYRNKTPQRSSEQWANQEYELNEHLSSYEEKVTAVARVIMFVAGVIFVYVKFF